MVFLLKAALFCWHHWVFWERQSQNDTVSIWERLSQWTDSLIIGSFSLLQRFVLLWESNATTDPTGGRVQVVMWVIGSGCKYIWHLLTHLPLNFCCVAQFLTGDSLVLICGLGIVYPWYRRYYRPQNWQLKWKRLKILPLWRDDFSKHLSKMTTIVLSDLTWSNTLPSSTL